MRRLPLLALGALGLFTSTVSRADEYYEPQRGPAYQLSLDVDAPLFLVGASVASSFLFLDELHGPSCAPVCDRSHLNFLDRPAAGLYDKTWANVGDIATAATMVFAPLVVLINEGLGNGANDDVVLLETALTTSALQISLSYAVERARPRVYGDRAPLAERTDANAARSFFSGHTANTVGISVAGMRTFQRLHKPALAWTVLGIGLAGSAVVGVARVMSGGHFPSDVLAGAAAGGGIGILVPALHRAHLSLTPMVTQDAAGAVLVGVLP